MKTLVALVLALAATAASAQAYRWVDENGVVHYTDRPRDGAEQIELDVGPPTRIDTEAESAEDAANTAADASPPPPSTPAAPPARETTEYERLEIIRPQQGEMLWNIGAVASVSLRLAPTLAPEHRIFFVYDGVRQTGLPTESLDIRMPNVFRGEHTLQAQVEDIDGNVIAQSNRVRFYVQQSVIRR